MDLNNFVFLSKSLVILAKRDLSLKQWRRWNGGDGSIALYSYIASRVNILLVKTASNRAKLNTNEDINYIYCIPRYQDYSTAKIDLCFCNTFFSFFIFEC